MEITGPTTSLGQTMGTQNGNRKARLASRGIRARRAFRTRVTDLQKALLFIVLGMTVSGLSIFLLQLLLR